ncbi:MAG: hypothetical protein ABIX12_09685 [Rubrivivax sp.]
MTHDSPQVTPPAGPRPWWREPMMWLVVGGPLSVVVASLVTAVIAVRYADPVLDTSAAPPSGADAQMPAMQARNHAATPPVGAR